jgi:hypothetical protein
VFLGIDPRRLVVAAAMCAGLVSVAACVEPATTRRVVPNYDPLTRRLIQLNADQNGDGRIDQWSYLDGQRPVRGEADTDDDGRIDRWEYFDQRAALTSVGTSSRGDGIEDTWTDAVAVNDERQVARSGRRDRQIDRREFYREELMVRVEEDTNADGVIDKWNRYEGTVLREVLLDTSLSLGRADRRLRYDAQGHFEMIEADPERDGTFVRLSASPVPVTPGDRR